MTDYAPKMAARVAMAVWLLLTIAVVVVLGFQFVMANNAVSDAAGDATRNVTWVGIPMFEVFVRDGKQGADIGWGLPVVLFGVPIGLATAIGLLARGRVSQPAGG